MAVSSVRELARRAEQEVGQAAVMTRRWVAVLSDDTLSSPTAETAVLDSTSGRTWGAAHPTFSSYGLRKITMEEGYEGSPYHVLVTGEYSIIRDEEKLAPADRTAQWSFESSSAEVPALYYYDGSGNGTTRPLTNSAYDYFPGLMTVEGIVVIKVAKNFSSFPSSWIGAQNFVNDGTYLGCATHSIRVAGVPIKYTYEEWGGLVVKYWAAEAELHYRQSGHNLQLPDIGFNFIADGQKRRAMVFDFENGEWVASSNPVGLNGSGAQTGGAPAILVRRVCPETNFQTLFGNPPT